MQGTYTVAFDTDRRIVRQTIRGPMDADGFASMVEETKRVSRKAGVQSNIRVLAVRVGPGGFTRKMRVAASRTMHDPELGKVAVVGMDRMTRIMARFVGLVGGTDRLRAFGDEETALKWLGV